MLAPFKILVFEYKSVVMKMFEDLLINHVAATNYELFCDVETMMGLTCVLPMLEVVQSLSKVVQNKDCFICVCVVAMKLTQVDIYNLYVDLKSHFFRNPSLGFATKARACKSAGQKGSSGSTFHVPGIAKECEGMKPHTPKGTPTLGVGVLVGF
jgi:hypothetical protein